MARSRKTNPDHKARPLYGFAVSCSCGWSSSTWYGKGARGTAYAEWHGHLENCEKSKVEPAR